MVSRRGVLGLLGFSMLLAIVLSIFLVAVFDNFLMLPDTVPSLFTKMMIAIVITTVITVFSYTYYLRGKVDWIYY
jgi:uncharacterized BrkB/YihY/UPF0761 family membrane protein